MGSAHSTSSLLDVHHLLAEGAEAVVSLIDAGTAISWSALLGLVLGTRMPMVEESPSMTT